MAVTLTERYVDAVVRTLPDRQRGDVATELRAAIADQIDARRDGGDEREFAERAVLDGLGDPDALAAGYADRPLHLLGRKYYLTWWRLLKLLLWIVLPCVAFAVSLGQTIAGAPVGAIIGTTWGITLTVAVHVCFWTTLVFVTIERSEARSQTDTGIGRWSVDDLPEPRERGASLADTVAVIGWLVLAAGAIVWDRTIGFIPGSDLRILDEGLWPGWIAALFTALAVEIALHLWVYRRGRWTPAAAVINAALDLAVAVPAIWLLASGRLIAPALRDLLPANATEVPRILTILIGFGIAAIAIWDAVDAGLKARRR